jgi:carbonic anhydrase
MTDSKRVLLSKRSFLRSAGLGTLAALVAPATRARAFVQAPPAPSANPAAVPSPLTGEEALRRLIEGNRRHLAGEFTITQRLAERRQAVAKVQRPFAAILGCSDSRLPPEIVFDHSLGDLFVVRVAGNIADEHGLASLEFAATQFGTPLVVVLGHVRCGAVAAALAGTEMPGHIGSLAAAIAPAVRMAKGQAGDPLDAAIRANIRMTVDELRGSKPILGELVRTGKLKVVGALYSLDTGKVEFLEP